MKEKITLFSVLGWEQRFIEGTNYILENNEINCIHLICFSDYFHMKNMKENQQIIKEKAKEKNIQVEILELEYDNSVNNWLKLDGFFKTRKFQDVLLNATTFPRETIWTLLFFLRRSALRVSYIYYKPVSYDKNEGGLTRNHKSPRLLFKHSGVFDLDKDLVIFVITGFDHNRMDLLIDHYEPTKVVYLSQKGEQFENMKRNSGIAPKTAYENIDIENIEIDSYNISETYETLNSLINAHADYNIIITSQGPKTSAISTYLAYLDNSNVALAYVPAREFSGEYSFGFDNNPVEGEVNLKM
ncbi:hypothetical protein [uncultured Draconibacterium sp.]|uniref:hypothetical protein n=1 Tax=uncultured Draconibacterium sp. TaxID=1573823 RepID=UPI0029C6BCF4|nr:hypothetical protein [uncultured Draconibacterium sp.]